MASADQSPNPKYVAIIMDGNGRWAKRRGLPVLLGHRQGAKALKRTVRAAAELDVKELTVYAFSTENWERPDDEVSGLMELFAELIEKETPELDEQGVRLKFIGRREGLSRRLIEQMEWGEGRTAGNDGMRLFVAFNYGGRAEIVDAVNRYLATGPKTKLCEDDLSSYLYAGEMHEPELLIRTSGELRISNFLLWQCAYSELFFVDTLWPDFDRSDLEYALGAYGSRQRRFGGRELG